MKTLLLWCAVAVAIVAALIINLPDPAPRDSRKVAAACAEQFPLDLARQQRCVMQTMINALNADDERRQRAAEKRSQ